MERVLHILSRTPVGGVGSFLINAESTISKDFAFDYLIIEDVKNSTFVSSVKKMGSNVYFINVKLSLLNYKKIAKKLDKIFDNLDYKIIHVHAPNIATLVLPICKKHNIPIRVLHSHSTKYSDTIIKSIRNLIIEFPMFKYATHLVACSNLAGKFLFKKRPYTLIYNGIDTNKFSYREIKKENDKCVLAHVGNFLPYKNHKFLMNIFNKLCAKNDNYILWLFGDGELRTKIEEMVKEYKLENKVVFYGRVPNMQDYYNKIDIFLLPSLYEGFPVAAMEAQAHGLPVIASSTVTDEIDFYGDDVFLGLEDKDIESWVNAIINTNLSNKRDKSEKFKQSKFNIKQTTSDLEKFYSDCINNLK